MTNNQQLKQLKANAGLTSVQIAALCLVSTRTVESWLCKSGNHMPDRALALLKLNIKDKK